MNESTLFIPNNYVVDEKTIDEYIQKKDALMKERDTKAVLNVLFTILITIVYYTDIITDIILSSKFYIDGDMWWFGITLGIVVFSSLLNTFVIFKYSYLQEFKFYLKKKQYLRIVIISFRLIFQLEMLYW
jgi:hypothetical protein